MLKNEEEFTESENQNNKNELKCDNKHSGLAYQIRFFLGCTCLK